MNVAIAVTLFRRALLDINSTHISLRTATRVANSDENASSVEQKPREKKNRTLDMSTELVRGTREYLGNAQVIKRQDAASESKTWRVARWRVIGYA